MIAAAHPAPFTVATPADAPASLSLELLEARRLRDDLANLLRREQAAMADFLLALAGFDRLRGWEPLGHASLFAFLTVELRLSRSAAFWRLSAARLLQRVPAVIEPLRDGRLCLSTTAELAKVLSAENLDEVLPRYFGLSAREAAEVTAALLPRERPPQRTVVTELVLAPRIAEDPARVAAPDAAACATAPAPTRTAGPVLTSEPNRPERDVAPRDVAEPLTADLRRLHVTVTRRLLKKLEAARDGLSHVLPGATAEQVLETALDLLLEKQARARGQVKKPRKTLPGTTATAEPVGVPALPSDPPPSFDAPVHRRSGPREAIPATVRRAVWARDGGCCSWPLDGGGRCGSTHRLELDHIDPWARFGEPTVDNPRVVCRAHNQIASKRSFGAEIVARYARM